MNLRFTSFVVAVCTFNTAFAQYMGTQSGTHNFGNIPHSSGPKSDAKPEAGTSKCFEVQDGADRQKLAALDVKLMELQSQLASTPDVMEKQIRSLIEREIGGMNMQTKIALNAQMLMQKNAQFLVALQSDPTMSKNFVNFQNALSSNQQMAEEYSKAGAFSLMFTKVDKRMSETSDAVTNAYRELARSIETSSGFSAEQKKEYKKSVGRLAGTAFESNSESASMVGERVETQAAVTRAVRDTAVGAGLVVGGMILAGSTTAAGATMTATSAARLGALAMNVARGATAGASINGGARLLAGNVGNIVRSIKNSGDFFCNLAKEQATNSKLLYAEATSAAKRGAVYGGIFGAGAYFANTSRYLSVAEQRGTAAKTYLEFIMQMEVVNSGVREFEREGKFMTALKEGVNSDDPIVKAKAISTYLDEAPLGYTKDGFNEKIASKLTPEILKSLNTNQRAEINEILDGLIFAHSRQQGVNLQRFFDTAEKAMDEKPQTAGEEAIRGAKVGGAVVGMLVTNMGGVTESTPELPLQGLRMQYAASRLDKILQSK